MRCGAPEGPLFLIIGGPPIWGVIYTTNYTYIDGIVLLLLGRFVIWICFSDASKHHFLGGAWMGWQPVWKKLPAGAVESGEKGDLPFAASFFLGAFIFCWPEAINLRGEGAFVFWCFSGLFFWACIFSGTINHHFHRTLARSPEACPLGWGAEFRSEWDFSQADSDPESG